MQSEQNRLKTFYNWRTDFISSEKLVKNGFFYLGWNDAVQCAFCDVEIMHWVEGDDIAEEHRRFSPDCPFVNQTYDAALQNNMDIDYDYCGISDFPMENITTRYESCFKEYNTYSSRLNSFKNWPNWANQGPDKLASAGFYYTGSGDTTVCFQCGGKLKNWEKQDIPWEQHAYYYRNCSYVQLVKGRDFIQRVVSESVCISSDSEKEELINSEKSDIEDFNNCKICFKALKNTCFVPCGHVVACGECSSTTAKCFICRRDVRSILRLYYC